MSRRFLWLLREEAIDFFLRRGFEAVEAARLLERFEQRRCTVTGRVLFRIPID